MMKEIVELAFEMMKAIAKAIDQGKTWEEVKRRPLGDFISDDAFIKVSLASKRVQDYLKE